MKIDKQALPKSEMKLTIQLTPEEMKKFKEQATKEISQHVKVPGFRPGHVPYEILLQHVHEEAIVNHAADLALPQTYSDAVLKEDIKAVARPKVKIIDNAPLHFEATVAVYPEVKIAGYQNLQLKEQEVKIEEKDIEEVLKDIQKQKAGHKEVDREAKVGDRVEIDFAGFDEGGAPLDNTQSSNHPLVIGEGSLVKDFEDQLVGMKKDEKKTFKVTFPKDYFHKPFREKKVEFKVEMKKVEEVTLPEWNEEFIESLVGEKKTLEEIKKMTRENLERDKKHQEKIRRENEFLEKITELVQVEIPDALLEEEIDAMIEEFQQSLGEKGLTLERFLEYSKKELKDLRDDRRKEAEKRLRLRFALQQVFTQDNIAVSDQEIEQEIAHIIGLYPKKEHYKIRKEYEQNYMRNRLFNKLKIEKLFEKYLGK
jgi:trigger factor